MLGKNNVKEVLLYFRKARFIFLFVKSKETNRKMKVLKNNY